MSTSTFSRWAILPLYLSSLVCAVLGAPPTTQNLGGEDNFEYGPQEGQSVLRFQGSESSIPAAQPYPPPLKKPTGNALQSLNASYHDHYHPLWEIDEFIGNLALEYSEYVSLVNLGHSAQGREMLAIQISKPSDNEPPPAHRKGERGRGRVLEEGEQGPMEEAMMRKKKENEKIEIGKKMGFVITGAQHAREWIASATALYLAHALVAETGSSNAMQSLLDIFDFHIIPVPNPDGYVHTWESDRFWYKNRMIVGPDERCIGIDLNRNWGYAWSPSSDFNATTAEGNATVNTDPCSHWYPGHRPFEAPEVNNIANYITQSPRLKVFMDLRSYGQTLSTPFSYSCEAYPAEAEDQIEAALGAVQAVRKKFGSIYTTGRLCDMLYPAPGNILDWMYGSAGIKYSFAAHLRDTGTYGYVLPPQWIRPVGEETSAMIEYLAKFITTLPKIHG